MTAINRWKSWFVSKACQLDADAIVRAAATSGFQRLAKMSDPFENLTDVRTAATVRSLASEA